MDADRAQVDEMKQEEHDLLLKRERQSRVSYQVAAGHATAAHPAGTGDGRRDPHFAAAHLRARTLAAIALFEQRE